MAQKVSRELTKREQQWRERIEGWRSSGQRQSEFCRVHGFPVSSFSYWKVELVRRAHLRAGEAAAPGKSPQPEEAEAPGGQGLCWQQVAWPAPPPTGVPSHAAEDGLEVVLPGGWSIRLGPRFEAESLKRLLGVLEVVSC
jgi:hypothetical protein